MLLSYSYGQINLIIDRPGFGRNLGSRAAATAIESLDHEGAKGIENMKREATVLRASRLRFTASLRDPAPFNEYQTRKRMKRALFV